MSLGLAMVVLGGPQVVAILLGFPGPVVQAFRWLVMLLTEGCPGIRLRVMVPFGKGLEEAGLTVAGWPDFLQCRSNAYPAKHPQQGVDDLV